MLDKGLSMMLPYYTMLEALLFGERKSPKMLQDALQPSPLTQPLGQDLGIGVIDWGGGICSLTKVHAFDLHILYHS